MMLAPHVGMAMPELAASEPLAQLVANVIRKRCGALATAVASHAHWDAAFFGLDRINAFGEATSVQQREILERCGRDLISEAFYIEKAGVAFAAKMVLLSETIDERKLYALFGADEAMHLHRLTRHYHARSEEPTSNPFFALLSDLIENGDRQSLQVIIQVVLEGWGLTHYRSLRDGCGSPALRQELSSILADEAAHHGSGVVLVADRELVAESSERIFETLTRFLAMVQAGPLAVYGAVAATLGPLAQAQRRRLWAELEPERSSKQRLHQLQHLLNKCPSLASVTERLARNAAFEPRCQLEPT